MCVRTYLASILELAVDFEPRLSGLVVVLIPVYHQSLVMIIRLLLRPSVTVQSRIQHAHETYHSSSSSAVATVVMLCCCLQTVPSSLRR
jgi:hypothetical protein